MVFSEILQEHQAVDETMQDAGGILDKKSLNSLNAPVKLIGLI